MLETIWFDRRKYEDAEARYQESLARSPTTAPQKTTAAVSTSKGSSPLVREIAKARSQIQQTLSGASSGGQTSDLPKRVATLEQENAQLKKVTEELKAQLQRLEARVSNLDKGGTKAEAASAKPQKPQDDSDSDIDLFGSDSDHEVKKDKKKPKDDSDSDIDLFGSESEEEDEEEAKKKEERLAAYAAKKAKKPATIAKSSILLDIKPWDDETDMAEMEKLVRSVAKDGLLWGASKLVPVAYGVKKLQISCVVEDEKIDTDFLEESITAFEDYVQSVDIAAFNKI